MLLRSRGGFVGSLLWLTGTDGSMPKLRTLGRRQKALTVGIPRRGTRGSAHLPINAEPVSARGSGESAGGVRAEGDGEARADPGPA